MKRVLAVSCAVIIAAVTSYGTLVYQDDCSTADGFHWIYEATAQNSSFSSDGSVVSFTEPDAWVQPPTGTVWATSQMAFDPSRKADYTLTFYIADLTGSASYKFALDQFDSDHNWITDSTIWNVYPKTEGDRTTIGVGGVPGTIVLDLNSLSYMGNTAYIAPKFDLTTGAGDQTLKIDGVTLDLLAIPEPGSLALVLGGGLAVGLLRKRSR